MDSQRILIVDDDSQIRRVLRMILTRERFTCAEAMSGEETMRKLRAFRPDLILLDLNLPGMGGLDTCRALRALSPVSIILLTVRDDEATKVEALDSGGDDYITKPFTTDELLARVRAALRRTPDGAAKPKPVMAGDLEIDFEMRRIRKAGKTVHLTPKEFTLLRYLVLHKGRPVTHRELLRSVWGADHENQRTLLRVFITSLRSKIESNPATPQYILTEPWWGYRFADSPA